MHEPYANVKHHTRKAKIRTSLGLLFLWDLPRQGLVLLWEELISSKSYPQADLTGLACILLRLRILSQEVEPNVSHTTYYVHLGGATARLCSDLVCGVGFRCTTSRHCFS